MTTINDVTLSVPNIADAEQFYAAAFGQDSRLRFTESEAPSTGFRGFTLSLIVSQPANALAILDAAISAGAGASGSGSAGATVLKPAAKSLWGFGGVVQAPDGTIWKVATSAKKDTAPASKQVDQIVLLLGATDVGASKKFYTDHGFTVARSVANTYVQFATPDSPIGLGLYRRKGLAKDAGVAADGTGSHRIAMGSDAGAFTDNDGFVWETSTS